MRHNKKWIRIYVNGKKVRSTGNEKWYRDKILRDLQVPIFSVNSKENGNEWDSFTLKESSGRAFATAIAEKGIVPIERIRYMPLPLTHRFDIRAELMTKKRGEKIIIGEFIIPYAFKWSMDLETGNVDPCAILMKTWYPDIDTKYIVYPLSKNEFTFLCSK